MAGGQLASFGQGSVGIGERALALSGIDIAAGTGLLFVPGLPVDEDLVGEGVLAQQQDIGNARLVPLRSRKGAGAASASRLLVGLDALLQQGTVTVQKGATAALMTSLMGSGQGTLKPARSKLLGGQLISASQTNVIAPSGPPVASWDPADMVFEQGTPSSFNLSIPSGYRAGGWFQVATGTLPAGVTLDEDGTVTYDGTSPVASLNVTFAYTELESLPTMTMTPNKPGTYPYFFAVYLNEGICPAGYHLLSPDDGNLRGTPINTWPDGSARTCVVYSTARSMSALINQSIKLRTSKASDVAGTPLTTVYIDGLLNNITFNFGFSPGPQTITNFLSTSPNYRKTWWANSKAICASYIIDLAPGVNVMQAVVDIHAFADGYCFVECVVENCKIDPSVAPMVQPPSTTYTNATIAVNGTTVGTVTNPKPSYLTSSTTQFTENAHYALRKFYVGAWVNPAGVATPIRGASDPWVEIVHDNAYLQALSCLPGKHSRTYTRDPQTSNNMSGYGDPEYGRPRMVATSPNGEITQPYGSDLYQPWDWGRHKGGQMGTAGQISIMQLPEWRYIQGTNKLRFVARSCLANTLVIMTYCVHYRNMSGEIPTIAEIGTKYQNSSPTSTRYWVGFDKGTREPNYELDHQPGIGMVTFMIQPSPCIIEMLQGIAVWNATYDQNPPCPLEFVQQRGRAWILRNLQAVYQMTPNGHYWQGGAEDLTYRNFKRLDDYRAVGIYHLNVFYNYKPGVNHDASSEAPGYSVMFWNYVWVMREVFHCWHNKTINDPTKRAEVKVLLDWMLQLPVRWVNEQAHTGGWRYIGFSQHCGAYGYPPNEDRLYGTAHTVIDPQFFATWDLAAQDGFADYPPPSTTGSWMGSQGSGYSAGNGDRKYAYFGTIESAGWLGDSSGNYDSYTMPMFAMAAEMDAPGASTMWTTVHDGITTMSTWLNGYAGDVANGLWPRNYPLDK